MSITTLIPAYKPQFLRQLLLGLVSQTVRPERVIISDDSPGGIFQRALQAPELAPLVEALRPVVIEGPRQGGIENRRQLLRHWNHSTSHVHFLFDDDIVYPSFYERHLKAHATGRTRCTVSRRWFGSETGDPVLPGSLPILVMNHQARLVYLSSEYLFQTSFDLHPELAFPFNWLGELSHAVFSRDCAETLSTSQLAGISYRGLGDLGAFLACSLDAPLGYINEYLGVFRLSSTQNTNQKDSLIFRQGVLAWIALGIASRRLGRLTPQQAMTVIRAAWPVFRRDYGERSDSQGIAAAIEALIAEAPGAEDQFLSEWALYA
jgi:hypothetical protein